jgi:hypothetical protein
MKGGVAAIFGVRRLDAAFPRCMDKCYTTLPTRFVASVTVPLTVVKESCLLPAVANA